MIKSFKVRNYKIIREARCESAGRVMFICGPNGVGKTTLLDALGRQTGVIMSPGTQIAVAPATRTWRKENLQSRMLHNEISSFDVFALSSQMGSYGAQFGRQIYQGSRDLWSDDDSKQMVKPLLAKLKNVWKDYVANQIAECGFTTTERTWPDPKSPVSAFTDQMFNELRYVDTAEEGEQTKVLFYSVNRSDQPPVDIDDLSSGEKAIFSIFLPVIEEDFRRQLGHARRELALIVDEVENHLHPSLQLRLLEYVRQKSQEGYQFICTTHSTVLIKACSPDELYHVLPAGLTLNNQFRQACIETYSLEEIVQDSVLFANGFQRHVFCEGFDPKTIDENNICDTELYHTLLDTKLGHKVIAVGSCDAVLAASRAASSTVFAPLCMAAIRDQDLGRAADLTAPWCDIVLPLYSLETLLLDEQAILQVVQRYDVKPSEIRSAIDRVIERLCDEEQTQLVTPGTLLKRKDGTGFIRAIADLKAGNVTGVFEIQPAAFRKVSDSWSKLEAARSDRLVATTNIKGKKIYRYLFEELKLRGRSFTQRAFADQIISHIRVNRTISWIDDLERIAKRGVGNALAQVLLSPVGQPIRENSAFTAALQRVFEDVDQVSFNGVSYAVIKPHLKIEDFAKKLAPLATALNQIMPDYRWTM
jgi:predicted ATPase